MVLCCLTMRGKLWFAVLVAPLSEIAVVVVIVLSTSIFNSHGPDTYGLTEILGAVVGWGMFAVPLAYLGALILGIPTHLFLRSKNVTGVWYYSLAGLVAGVIIAIAPSNSLNLGWTAMAVLSSVTVATAFGFLVVAEEPDEVAI